MMNDIECLKKTKPTPKEIRIIETVSKNVDYMYYHTPMPFPMSDRDFVQKRVYLNNKDDPELVKQLGLYNQEQKYYVMMAKSVERSDCPVKGKLIRGEVKMDYWLIEEVPGEKDSFIFKSKTCQALNGSIPLFILNDMGPKMAPEMMREMLNTYKEIFGNS